MKILIISGFDKEIESANTHCLNELVKTLKENKNVEMKITGSTLTKSSSNVNWKKSPFLMIKKIINWPVISPKASEECYKQIMGILSKEYFDVMLVMHMPYDSVLAAMRVKKSYPNLFTVLYELDPIAYEIDKQRNSLGKYLYFLRERAEKKTFQKCDLIVHMECNRKKYEHPIYKCFQSKEIYLDFPLIHDKGIESHAKINYKGQKIKLIYTGKLMSAFRSPEYLLKVLVEVCKDVNLEINFFSKGDCETLLNKYAIENKFVCQRGYVGTQELEKEIEESDYLVNIGNKMSDMLPSKLLTYIEKGKPIIHVKNQENDACIPYLEKYGAALIIDESKSIDESSRIMVNFLKNNLGRHIGSNEIICLYPKNVPEYSAKVLYENILERMDKYK